MFVKRLFSTPNGMILIGNYSWTIAEVFKYILVPKVDSFVKEEHSKSLLQRQTLLARPRKCSVGLDEQDALDIVISKNSKNLKFWELPVTHDVNVSSKFDRFKIHKTTSTFPIYINSLYGSKASYRITFCWSPNSPSFFPLLFRSICLRNSSCWKLLLLFQLLFYWLWIIAITKAKCVMFTSVSDLA